MDNEITRVYIKHPVIKEPNKDVLFQCVSSDKNPKKSKRCDFSYSRAKWNW